MEENNFEYKGEKFSFHWSPEERILYINTWGSHTEVDAKGMKEKIDEFLEKFSGLGTLNILVDITGYNKTEFGARKVYTEIFKYPRKCFLAVCGVNMIAKLVTGFMMAAAKRGDIKFFTSTKDGLKWLKGKK